MATADEFLEAASALIVHGTPGPGHWRRSISTAYYAAFHCVVEAVCSSLFSSVAACDAAKQWFEHGSVADVAASIASMPTHQANEANWLASNGSNLGFSACPKAEFRDFGQRLRSLYDKRQQADYFDPKALQLGEGDARSALVDATAICARVASWTSGQLDKDFELLAIAMLRKSVRAKVR